ncbi:MAG: hypothetical protein J6B62_04645 [Bacteroidales bacterium]|nr:hypothetical protein [Bacteroidales bacterium]
MRTNCDFIELYDMAGTRFFGEYSCLEAAKPRLNELKGKGELKAINHALLMYEYRRDKSRGYVRTGIKAIHYKNGWRIKK